MIVSDCEFWTLRTAGFRVFRLFLMSKTRRVITKIGVLDIKNEGSAERQERGIGPFGFLDLGVYSLDCII